MFHPYSTRAASLVALLLLGACSTGEVPGAGPEDKPGTDQPETSASRVKGRVGAEAGMATTVRAYSFSAEGQPIVHGEAEVSEGGSYEVEVPAEARRVVIEASGEAGIVGAVLVARTALEGETVLAAPIDAETSLEASVYVAVVSDGMSPDEIDVVGLRARIDAAVAAAAEASADAEATVSSLAMGVHAALEAEARAYAAAGAEWSADAAIDATAEASAAYDAALDAAEEGAAEAEAEAEAAYEAFV
ncbi:MAG: hypothetical protein ACK4YP_22635, partial [Myxococcota bacterium]